MPTSIYTSLWYLSFRLNITCFNWDITETQFFRLRQSMKTSKTKCTYNHLEIIHPLHRKIQYCRRNQMTLTTWIFCNSQPQCAQRLYQHSHQLGNTKNIGKGSRAVSDIWKYASVLISYQVVKQYSMEILMMSIFWKFTVLPDCDTGHSHQIVDIKQPLTSKLWSHTQFSTTTLWTQNEILTYFRDKFLDIKILTYNGLWHLIVRPYTSLWYQTADTYNIQPTSYCKTTKVFRHQIVDL